MSAKRFPRTIRPRSARSWAILPCVLAFGLVAAAVYWMGLIRTNGEFTPDEPRFTATAYVVDRSNTAAESSIPFTWSGENAAEVLDAADGVAACYACDLRARWTLRTEKRLRQAKKELETARERHEGSQNRLDAFQRQLSLETAAAPDAPPSAAAENPDWTELQKKLAKLESHKKELLVTRTPVNPLVVLANERIEAVQLQLAKTPQTLPRPTEQLVLTENNHVKKHARPRTQQEQTELDARAGAVAVARDAYEEAATAVKRIEAERRAEPGISVISAQLAETPVASDPRQWLPQITFAAAALAAMGLGALLLGVGILPVVGTPLEVQLAAFAPVIAIVPAEMPVSSPEKLARGQRRMRRMMMATGWFLMAACPIVALVGLGWM